MILGRRSKRDVPPWIFTYDTANVLFNKNSFSKCISTLTNHLRWLTLRARVIKAKWGQNGLNYS